MQLNERRNYERMTFYTNIQIIQCQLSLGGIEELSTLYKRNVQKSVGLSPSLSSSSFLFLFNIDNKSYDDDDDDDDEDDDDDDDGDKCYSVFHFLVNLFHFSKLEKR